MQAESMKVLSGDIGGTKTRLAIVTVEGSKVRIEYEASFSSQAYDNFETLLGEFLSDKGRDESRPYDVVNGIKFSAFGVAGPVQGRAVQTTNLPWRIDADALQRQFGFIHCTLLNDLEATAYGLPALAPEDLLTLQAGAADSIGNIAVIAAGTGLGEAGLYWDGKQHQPFATEGGHASFSPANTLEFSLLRHLQQQYQHVSWERVVSGMGIVSLHEFLRQYRSVDIPDWLAQEMRDGGAAAISNAAGRDEICAETMHLFVRLYGAEAGNLALKVMSRGGIYLGGGIAPKILTMLTGGEFLEAFLGKGRMRPLLETMPVKVILNDRAALYGPALRAAHRQAG
ncbi:MAG: glucokinase [Gallionella sp.]|jgi:glucokinase